MHISAVCVCVLCSQVYGTWKNSWKCMYVHKFNFWSTQSIVCFICLSSILISVCNLFRRCSHSKPVWHANARGVHRVETDNGGKIPRKLLPVELKAICNKEWIYHYVINEFYVWIFWFHGLSRSWKKGGGGGREPREKRRREKCMEEDKKRTVEKNGSGVVWWGPVWSDGVQWGLI